MGTPNPKKTSTPKLTPEQAAELNRMQAAKRQADKRRRERELAEEQARMLAETMAEEKAHEEARVQHLADLERRVLEAERAARTAQGHLDDAITLLAIHHDVGGHRRLGMTDMEASYALVTLKRTARRFEEVSSRYWTCSPSEARTRVQGLIQSIQNRVQTLQTPDDPVTVTRNVTALCTPVTATVRGADRTERIADRSHEIEVVTPEEQAWRDSLGDSPFDPYHAEVERIEAIAEGLIEDDDGPDDDGERF